MAQDLKRCKVILDSDEGDAAWGWDILSRIFHFGTKDIVLENQPASEQQWAAQYLQHCNEVLDETSPVEQFCGAGSGIRLPDLCATDELDELFAQRATVRAFHQLSIPLAELGRILHHTLGFVEGRKFSSLEGGVEQFSERRSSPSAGGLNSTGGYVYVANVQGLEPGIYYYDPQHHQLHWRSQLATRLGDLISGQHFANDIPMGLFLTSRFDKLWWKYQHSRAYRMALIEIGHVAQTFQLAVTARRMKTWLTGALNESLIEPLLKFENPNEQVIFFVGCGYSDGSTIPNCLKSLVK